MLRRMSASVFVNSSATACPNRCSHPRDCVNIWPALTGRRQKNAVNNRKGKAEPPRHAGGTSGRRPFHPGFPRIWRRCGTSAPDRLGVAVRTNSCPGMAGCCLTILSTNRRSRGFYVHCSRSRQGFGTMVGRAETDSVQPGRGAVRKPGQSRSMQRGETSRRQGRTHRQPSAGPSRRIRRVSVGDRSMGASRHV